MSDQQNLQADRIQIEKFVRTVFKNATTGWISLRAFTHDKPSKPWGRSLSRGDDGKNHMGWSAVPVTETDRLVDMATRTAELCANADEGARVVFAPPVCTLNSSWGARTEHIAEGVTLAVECDGPDELHQNARPPVEAFQILREIMGPPTLAMVSGSIWTDGQTGEQQPKCHYHYRLRVPTRSPEDHEKLREARNLLAKFTGSDASATPLVHPLRWAGSWNRKTEPRLAEITEINDEIDIDLDETLIKLRTIAAQLEPERATATERRPRNDNWDEDDDIEAKAIAALAVIPNNYDREEWVIIGMEIHAAFGGSGSGLNEWDRFSSQWGGYNRADTERVWKSFRPGARTAGSLFYRADQIDPSWRDALKRTKKILPGANDSLDEMIAQCRAETPAEPQAAPGRGCAPATPIEDRASSNEPTPIRKGKIRTRAEDKLAQPPKMLIEGLLPEDSNTALYAPMQHLKSFVALDMAYSIATGCQALGSFTVNEPGPVIYWCAEGYTSMVKKRATAWEIAHQHEPYSVEQICFANGVPIMSDDKGVEDDIEDAKAFLNGRKARFFVIDTLNRSLNGADEDKSHVAGSYFNRLQKMRERIGGTSLTISHMGWDAMRERGSSGFPAGFDTVIWITKCRRDEDTNIITIELFVRKQKDGEAGQHFYMQSQIVETPDGNSLVLLPCDAETAMASLDPKSPQGISPKEVAAALRELVGDGGHVGTTALAKKIAAMTDPPRKLNTVEQALTRNRTSGKKFHPFVLGNPDDGKWCMPGRHLPGSGESLADQLAEFEAEERKKQGGIFH